MGAWLLLGALVGGGCGDDERCPTGTAGSPCRYVSAVGDAPDAWPSSLIDVDGADTRDGSDAVSDTPGDVDALDDADPDDGTSPTDAADDASSDAEDADTMAPTDARAD